MIKLMMLPKKTRLKDNGYSPQEEMQIFWESLQFVIDNPRFVLDNLHRYQDFRVSWHNYKTKTPVTIPKTATFIKDSSPIYKGRERRFSKTTN